MSKQITSGDLVANTSTGQDLIDLCNELKSDFNQLQVDDVAGLRLVEPDEDKQQISMSGNAHGIFYYDAADTSTADDSVDVIVTTGGARWKRLISSDVTANTTHRTSDGSDHTFIDQDVTVIGQPTFGRLELVRNFSNDYLIQLSNTQSFSSAGSRAVRQQFKLGDSGGDEVLAGIYAKAGASTVGTTRHDLVLEVYDGALSAFEGALRIDGSSRDIEAFADNLWNCGSASFRWKEVYAATATINTSDERLKKFLTIDDAEKAAALEIKANLRKFKFNDAIEEKGDGARIHFGASAQQVGQIMADHGLNPDDYAFYCYDEWGEEVEDGEIVQESGNRYGIRYEELLSFILAAL